VRVAATSVNPIDYKRRAGLTKDFYPMHFPGLIGVDMAVTVVKIGPGWKAFPWATMCSLWRTILTPSFVSCNTEEKFSTVRFEIHASAARDKKG